MSLPAKGLVVSDLTTPHFFALLPRKQAPTLESNLRVQSGFLSLIAASNLIGKSELPLASLEVFMVKVDI